MVVAVSNIEGGHGLPLECHDFAQKLHKVVKAIKSRFGDYYTKEKSPMRYFREVINRVNKK